MELESKEDFLKVLLKTDLVLRIDPFLIINYYGIFMYIDLRRLDESEVRGLLHAIKDKVVNVRRHLRVQNISELLESNI